MTQRCNIALDCEFVREVDEFADSLCLSRSALITLALKQYMNAYKSTRVMLDMAAALQKIAESAEKGLVTDEQLKELEHYDFLSKVLSQNMGVSGSENS